MSRVDIVRIEQSRMEALVGNLGNEDTPGVYTDRSFFVRELFWRRLAALFHLSQPPARHRVLDFGGGNGVLTPTLSRSYQEVVCVDLRTEMAEEIARTDHLPNVTIRAGDLLQLGLPHGHFDTIVAADVLEHIQDLDTLVTEFARLLVAGGELLASVPSENRFYEIGRRVFGYTKPEDHYHEASYVEGVVCQRLPMTRRRYFPINVSWLAVFSLGRYAKPAGELS
jgi:SAM-dependent methyltransferase